MSRSIHQTVKAVFHGKSRAEVNTMFDPQPPDPDVVALQRRSAIKPPTPLLVAIDRIGLLRRGCLRLNGLALLVAPMASFAAPSPAAMPPEAQAVIQQVRLASKRHDLQALRALMDAEFTSSFGGNGGIDEALGDWKRYPSKLNQLHRATGMPCEPVADVWQCPRNAGASYRAGFKLTKLGWRMVYFVVGD